MIADNNRRPLLCKSLIAFALFSLVFLASERSVLLNINPPIAQSPIAEERVTSVLPAHRMPAASTVAITAIRNLQNRNWLEDLEIEVQNNSYKPIYFLNIILKFPELPRRLALGEMRGYVISLTYGRWELIKAGQSATAEDVPINPGERYVFKVPEPKWKGLQATLADNNLRTSMIKKIDIRIYMLSYGDETGFKMGAPFSFSRKSGRRSSSDSPKIYVERNNLAFNYLVSDKKNLLFCQNP